MKHVWSGVLHTPVSRHSGMCCRQFALNNCLLLHKIKSRTSERQLCFLILLPRQQIQLSALIRYFDFLQTRTELFFTDTEFMETTVITQKNQGNHMVLSWRCHSKRSSITLGNNKRSHTVDSHNPPRWCTCLQWCLFPPSGSGYSEWCCNV